MEKQMEKELAELEAERARRLKEKKMRRFVAEKAAANDLTSTLKQSNKDKLKEYK